MADRSTPPDPYDRPPSLWQRYPHLGWILGVFGATTLLTYASFPPLSAGEAGYGFALAAVLWAYRRPPFRVYAWTVLGAQVVAWTLLLGWLYHVTWVGLFLLGPFVGLVIGVWYLGVWWTIPRLAGHRAIVRIVALFGLAALWVVLEWLRGVIFGGFPWLPLAASQWQRPLLLQCASYTGAGGVSFVLIFFNLAAAAYAHRIFFEGATGLRKRSPEFMVALLLLMGSTFPLVAEVVGQRRVPLARIALVQPYIPQDEKWESDRATDVLNILEKVTFAACNKGAPDFVVWPEAVTPWALFRDPNVEPWLDSVAKRAGRPLLLGTVYTSAGAASEDWHNGAFVVDPAAGVVQPGYAKRKLVPFGEYIPLRPVLGWLEKVTPIGGDFERGSDPAPLVVPVGTHRLSVGILICYEDVFPNLARSSVQSGADLLAVLTNNAWFGEGGAAYQHAAHSVLRAVENRRPVIRCGNGGWSGWIDEFGQIRAVLTNEDGSVYFRGSATVTVTRDARWRHRESYYTEHGDWLLPVCVALAGAAYYLVLLLRPPPVRPDGETVF